MALKRKESFESTINIDQQTNKSHELFDMHLKRQKIQDNSNNGVFPPSCPESEKPTFFECSEFRAAGRNSTLGFCNESNEGFRQFDPSQMIVDCNSSSVPRTVEKLKVVVIGAGISGLGAAVILKKAGADVIVLEGSSKPGGRMKSVEFPSGGKLESVSVDTGADLLIDCSDASNNNLLYDLARVLRMKTMMVSCGTNWDSPLASKMINLQGKAVDPRIIGKMFLLHQAIICLGIVRIIRNSGFDIPELSYDMKLDLRKSSSKDSPAKAKKLQSKIKINGKADIDVPKRGNFDFGDGEIEDVMEDTFTKLSMKNIIEYGKEEYSAIRPLNLSEIESSVLECIFTRLYGRILPLDRQNGWDLAYAIHGPLVGLKYILKLIEGPTQQNISNLTNLIKKFMNDGKKARPIDDDVIIIPEDLLICDSSSIIIDELASKVDILYNKLCRFVHYKDYGVVVDCTDDGVCQSFDADYCIITVPPGCLQEGVDGIGLQIFPQMSRAKSSAIKRITTPVGEVPAYNKVILRFDKIFWDPNMISIMNPETRVSISNYHKVGKENVICIHIWASAEWNIIHFSDEDVCRKCCDMLKSMFPKTYKSSIKLVNWFVSRWNEDPLYRCSSTGQGVFTTSNDFILLGTPLPSVENPRVCFAGEATIDMLSGPVQTAHGAFQTGVREARRIANKANLRCIPKGSALVDFITAESNDESEREVQEEKESKFGTSVKTKKAVKDENFKFEIEAHNTH